MFKGLLIPMGTGDWVLETLFFMQDWRDGRLHLMDTSLLVAFVDVEILVSHSDAACVYPIKELK